MDTKETYSYAEIEEIMARMYGATSPDRQLTLRARIKNFQRLGIPLDRRPGKGSKKPYSLDELYQLLLCLELAQLTIDPSVIVGILNNNWDFYREVFRAEVPKDFREDRCVVIVVHSLSSRIKEGAKTNDVQAISHDPAFFDLIRNRTHKHLSVPPHSILLNISDIVREFRLREHS